MPLSRPLRVVVCGAGAFGRNHVRVYQELQEAGVPVELAAIVEPSPEPGRALSATVPVLASIDECIAQLRSGALQLDVASVCVPTSAHFEVASRLLSAGLHVLVEKPITSTLEQADELIRLSHHHRRLLQVGHLERFNPAVASLEGRIHKPMFFEAHRLSIFTPRALDVDVVLDLMIHDLDIVLQLAQSPIAQVHAVGLPILSSKVDIANARVEFASGCVANFTASRVSTERVRKLRFFQPHQYISVDYARQDLLIVAVDPGTQAIHHSATHGASQADHGHAGLSFDKPAIVAAEPLRLEIAAFLASVQQGTAGRVPATQGRQALALALEVQAAMQAHSDRAGLAYLTVGGPQTS